jgi:hypothetical protein
MGAGRPVLVLDHCDDLARQQPAALMKLEMAARQKGITVLVVLSDGLALRAMRGKPRGASSGRAQGARLLADVA